MLRKFTFALCLGITFGGFFHTLLAQDSEQHEWTKIRVIDADSAQAIAQALAELQYPQLNSKDSICVAEYIDEHPVTLIWYFASWCWNCNQEAPVLHRLYQKYHSNGFQVLGIGVYSPEEKLKEFQTTYALEFPIVVGPSTVKEKASRQLTYHYRFRKAVGDSRTWGTPFSVFILNGNLSDIKVAAGEFTEKDLNTLLKNHLQPEN